jgi:hypothetical protein
MKKSNNKSSTRKLAKSTASDESNDTFASRRYLKDSLAKDPWTGRSDQSHRQHKNESNEPATYESDKNPRKKTRSKKMLHASMLDAPNMRDSMVTTMLSNTSSRSIDVNDDGKKNRIGAVDARTTSQPKRDNRASVNKDTKALPSTELLSSLGLDESEAGNRTSVFSSYWDANNLHLDDEGSGAMALVRSIEDDVIRQDMEKKWWYCLVEKFNPKIIILCVVIFVVAVMLVMVIPYPVKNNEVMSTSNEFVPTLLPTDQSAHDNTLPNTTISNTGETIKEQLTLSEEVIRICNPNGYDYDKYKCQNMCLDKECCFADPDDINDEYCGDEIWHNCLEYAGCQPLFSRRK